MVKVVNFPLLPYFEKFTTRMLNSENLFVQKDKKVQSTKLDKFSILVIFLLPKKCVNLNLNQWIIAHIKPTPNQTVMFT